MENMFTWGRSDLIFILIGNTKRAYHFSKDQYHDGDVIHIDLAQEVSFLNKSAIKTTLLSIPENSKVIINASDTVYIAHDVLDLIKDFKKFRAKDENIKVKLLGFKKAYNLENSEGFKNTVTYEHKYDAMKRQTVEVEVNNDKNF